MTTRTWNGANGSFDNAADWSPVGVPQAGDTAAINSGVVTANGQYFQGLQVQLNGSASAAPQLYMNSSNIPFGGTLSLTNSARITAPAPLLYVAGPNTNSGIISMGDSRYDIQFVPGSYGAAVLWNLGAVNMVGSSPLFDSPGSYPLATIQNQGALSFWNPSGGAESAGLDVNIAGEGTIQINPNSRVVLSDAVGADQTVDFSSGATANSFLQIGNPGNFQALISGFTAGKTIFFQNFPFTSLSYTQTSASGGTLSLFNNGTQFASLRFNGSYSQSDFVPTYTDFGNGITTLSITTTANPAQIISVSDTTVGLAMTDTGQIYSGPVAGLQHQYIWTSPDAVAMSSSADNVFLHGGAGNDALSVQGGINVLDGGGGSNFLVGSLTSTQDTFYVDGRGGVPTWSTLVNFHLGDQATIFGFHAGTSTLPFTANDGVGDYQGVTIHSELNGAGTGVNASITFARISMDTLSNHFTFTTGTINAGTANAIDYLLIQYNR